MENLILVLIVIAFAFFYFKKHQKDDKKSNELLLTLNENLRKEIQEIRKEISDNSEKEEKK